VCALAKNLHSRSLTHPRGALALRARVQSAKCTLCQPWSWLFNEISLIHFAKNFQDCPFSTAYFVIINESLCGRTQHYVLHNINYHVGQNNNILFKFERLSKK
jgi:hypothetical protein